MATTPILGITQLTASQNTKEVTINDAIVALEAAANAKLDVDFSASTSVLLSATQTTRNFIFVAKNATADSILRLPNTVNSNNLNRLFAVRNDSGYQITVKFNTGAGTQVIIPDGATRLLDAMEGTDIIVAAEPTTVVTFLDLSDAPSSYSGQAGKFLTANVTEDALEFADAAQFPSFTGNEGKYLVVNATEDGVEWVDASAVASFLDLTDTPSSYTGQGGKIVAVNSGATGVEFIDMPDIEAVEYVTTQRWRVRIDLPNVEDQVAFGEIEFLDVDGFNLCASIGGTASASSEETGREVEFAFDEDTTAGNGWFSELAFAGEEWVEFEFTSPVQPRNVRLWPVTGFPDYTPLQFAFERFDGTDWVEAGLRTPSPWVSEEPQTFKINGVPFSSVVDAPIDGTPYVRQDGDWAPLPASDAFPPLAGNEGKLLAVATGETDVEWIDPPQSLPAGGTTGQALIKQSSTDGDAAWQDIPGGGGGGGGSDGSRVLLATFTATGGETGFSFTGIPAGYEDLLLVFNCRGDTAAGDIQIDLQYNGSATGYSWQQLFNGSSASGSSDTKLRQFQCAAASTPSGVFSAGELRIFKYSSTVAHKVNTLLANNSNGAIPRILTGAGRWANTAAINRIDGIVPAGGLVAGSTVRLYGLKSGSNGGGGNWWFDPPLASSFALASGDGTPPILTDDTDAGLLFDFGAFTASDDNRFAYQTLSDPTLDWEVTTAFNPLLLDTGIGFGIGIMNNSNGRVLTFITRDTGWRMYYWSALTTFNSVASTNANPGQMTSRNPAWLRVSRVSGNLLFKVSADGKQWAQVGSVALSAYLSNPDRVGLIGNYATTSYRGYAAVEAFYMTGPAI